MSAISKNAASLSAGAVITSSLAVLTPAPLNVRTPAPTTPPCPCGRCRAKTSWVGNGTRCPRRSAAISGPSRYTRRAPCVLGSLAPTSADRPTVKAVVCGAGEGMLTVLLRTVSAAGRRCHPAARSSPTIHPAPRRQYRPSLGVISCRHHCINPSSETNNWP
jgi:hypothetical protein